jgi:hypothetical protein
MHEHAKYYRDCVKLMLRGKGDEPLGAARGLHWDQAEEIAASAHATLKAGGARVAPRHEFNRKRLAKAYTRRGLRPPPDA